MKKAIWILIVSSAFLTSCGCLHRATKETRNAASSEHATIEAAAADTSSSVKTTTQREALSMASDLKENEKVVTEVYDYDTTQPRDSTTGQHPVIRYTRQERQRSAVRNDRLDAGKDTEASDISASGSSENFSADMTGESQSSEDVSSEQAAPSGGMSKLQRFLCWVGGLTILVFIAYVFIKLKF